MILKEKPLINKILQKEEFTKDDTKELISILSKLPTEELITLLGNEFKKHTQNYVKWGWDYDQSVKALMLNNYVFSNKQNIEKNDEKNQFSIDSNFNNEYLEKNFNENNIVSDTTLSRNKDKFRLFRDLGFSPIKCKECDADINLLVALQLHHPTDHKEITLSDFYTESDYYLALEKFKKDKVEILCSNHHLEKQVFYPHIFRDLIFKEDLFLMSAQEIDEYIDNYLSEFFQTKNYYEIINEKYLSKNKQVPEKIKIKWKYQIKKWMKKRFCFEELFNGKCIVCGNSNLIHLNLHHVFPELKNIISNWQSISKFDCVEIIRLIMQEKCICLCSNCHNLIESKFHLTVRDVLDGFIPQSKLNNIYEDVILRYNLAILKISNYEHNLKNSSFRSPLKLEFSQLDIWKIRLLEIYYFLEKRNKEYFNISRFSTDMQLDHRHVLKFINKLVKLKYLNKNIIENYENRYSLTKLGRNTVMFLLNRHSEKANSIRNSIDNKVNSKYINIKSFDSYQDVLIKYPMKIYKIIKEKGVNEFTSKELAKEVGKGTDIVNKHIRTKLIINDIVCIVDNPISIKEKPITNKNPPSREKVYSLTPKGFKIAKNELDTNNKCI